MSGSILERPDAQSALLDWLAGRVGNFPENSRAMRIDAPSGGWSNETRIVTAGDRRMVVRLAPDRLSMFPDYDLDKEWRIIRALYGRGAPPVPQPLAEDLSGELFGRPFFVMSHVDGVAPSDNKPTYAEAGWLAEGPVAARHRFWDSFAAAMAAVHDTPWRESDLSRLAPAAGETSLVAAVRWLEELHRWSDAPQPEIEAGLARLRETLPSGAGPDVLLWGDARPANVLARDFRITALLDWELASTGPVEMDVTWFQEMHWMRTEGSGVPLPEGFPDDAAIAAGYERASGRRLGNLVWYRLLAAVKVAVLLYRHLVVAIDRGAMPAGHPLLRENIATRRLASLLA